MRTLEDLKQMILGFRWEQFGDGVTNNDGTRNPLIIQGVEFHGRVGVHLGRPAIAIIAQGYFVAIRHFILPLNYYMGRDWVLIPADPSSGKPIEGWGLWDKDCGLDCTDRIIKEQDHAQAQAQDRDLQPGSIEVADCP